MVDPHALKIIEFDEVKRLISRKTHWEKGNEMLMSLVPLPDIDDILEFQHKVRQVEELLNDGGTISLSGLSDISDVLKASTKGVTLPIPDFLAIHKNIQITAALKKHLNHWAHLPYMAFSLERIDTTPHLEKVLSYTFDSKGEVLDSASPELREIRERVRDLEEKIHNKIQGLLRDQASQKMIQEHIVTVREGRYVLPIKSEYRGVFEGLVQDTSGSGATVFMEPMEVVAPNNDLKQARGEERREIEQILRNLSRAVSQVSKGLLRNLDVLAELDMLGALAFFSIDSRGLLPPINRSGRLVLIKARHPLLGKKAVPIDVEIGGDFNTLVITGPNTGGKTVTLKTMGLFTLMALSGMPINASPGSEVPLVSGVFADIGDEQSITQNLSTFSSHVSQIIRILNQVDRHALVLLDELGAGTDPKEGTALGIAILEHLSRLGARTVITTHYSELKYFASTNPEARNASVEFDSETLQPSYRIQIGLPGSSCALAIAGRLGLPSPISARAEELISKEFVSLDRLIEQLKFKEKEMARELESEKDARREAERLKNLYEEELSQVHTEKTEILTEASSEAEILVYAARSEIRKSLKEFRKRLSEMAKAPRESLRDIDPEEMARETLTTMDEVLERLEKFKTGKKLASHPAKAPGLKVGDRVYIPSMERKGDILEVHDDDLLIQVEKVKITLPSWKIKPVAGEKRKLDETMIIASEKSMADRLDLRGLYVDEALFELEKHLDSALLNEQRSFQILHGKGTGALRNAIQMFLKKHTAVARFRPGESHEGSWGVTVVELQ
jgi:DNA mismatch repair protein MutS2